MLLSREHTSPRPQTEVLPSTEYLLEHPRENSSVDGSLRTGVIHVGEPW